VPKFFSILKNKVLQYSILAFVVIFCAALLVSNTLLPKTTENPENKVVTIEYWHVNSESFGGEAVRQLVDKFNETHKDIKVVAKFQPNMYLGLMQNLQAAISSGNMPDVAQIGYNFMIYTTNSLPHYPIYKAIQDDKDGKDFISHFPSNILKLGEVNNKLEGMPYSISDPVLYYNKDLLAKVGIEQAPQNWEEVVKVAKLIKDKTGNYGLYIQEPADNWAQQALIESNGGRILSKEGNTWKATFNSPGALDAYSLYANMVKDGLALHAPWDQGTQAFVAGKVAMTITTIAKRNYIENNAKFKVGTAMFPEFSGKKRMVPAGGNALFIFSKDPVKQRAAWEFIKFLESPEALTIWTKGTGYLPPRSDVLSDANYLKPFMDSNPLMRAAVEEFPDIVPWVSFPGNNGLQCEQVMVDAREAILSGKADPKSALDNAVNKVNDLIK